MDSGFLNKKGTSVLEVTAVLFLIGMVFLAAIPNYIERINRAKYVRLIDELTVLSKAAVDFYQSQGSWPSGISSLAPQYMPFAVTSSPFGTSYQMSFVNSTVTVSALMPQGIAQNDLQGPIQVVTNQGTQDLVEITQQLPNEFSGRLEYEKQYRYLQ